MRKLLSLMLALLLAANISVVRADYIVGSQQSGREFNAPLQNAYPIEVEVLNRESRYAVDIEYTDFVINVKSAIWNVNTYVYDVEMEGSLESVEVMQTVETTTFSPVLQPSGIDYDPMDSEEMENTDVAAMADSSPEAPSEPETTVPVEYIEQLRSNAFTVTIINHSDKSVYAKITPQSKYPEIRFEQNRTFENVVTVPGAIMSEIQSQSGAVQYTPSYISSPITAVATPEDWQIVINEMIKSGDAYDGSCVLGTLTVVISQN